MSEGSQQKWDDGLNTSLDASKEKRKVAESAEEKQSNELCVSAFQNSSVSIADKPERLETSGCLNFLVRGTKEVLLAEDSIEFVRLQEKKLKPGERLWLRTEIIESVFGRYKQFEGEHSKGGFTTPPPSLASLVVRICAKEIKSAFGRLSVQSVKEWIGQNLANTVPSKRRRVSRQFRKSISLINQTTRATNSYATNGIVLSDQSGAI